MPKAHQNIEWPSDDEIVRLVAEHGYAQAAKVLGVSRTGLQDHANRHDLRDRITEAKTVKVEFDDVPPASYAQAYFSLKEGLESLFGRPVDVVTSSGLENPFFRERIDAERRTVYAR
jgi:predicted nucleotidyltransferase